MGTLGKLLIASFMSSCWTSFAGRRNQSGADCGATT